MGLGLRLGCVMEQRQMITLKQVHQLALGLEQKLALKCVLELRQELHTPEPPEAIRGVEGMLAAHELLQKRESVGLLVGGLSEEVWNYQTTEAAMAAHKDVDVLVITPFFELHKKFEQGIDWWLPISERITIKRTDGTSELEKKWWQNGYGVALNYGVNIHTSLKPGLYFPSPDFVLDMRFAEMESYRDDARIASEEDGEQSSLLRERLAKKLKINGRVPPFLETLFEGYIAPRYETIENKRLPAFTAYSNSLDTMTGIHRAQGKGENPTPKAIKKTYVKKGER